MGQTWSSTPRPDEPWINDVYNFLDGHIKSQFNDSPKADRHAIEDTVR